MPYIPKTSFQDYDFKSNDKINPCFLDLFYSAMEQQAWSNKLGAQVSNKGKFWLIKNAKSK